MRALLSASLVLLTVALAGASAAHAQAGAAAEAQQRFYEHGIVGVVAVVLAGVVVALAGLLWKQWQAQTVEIKATNAAHAAEIKMLNDRMLEWATKTTDMLARALDVMNANTAALNANTTTAARHEASLARSVERLEDASGRVAAGGPR